MHYLLYVTYFINVTHAYAIRLTPLQNLLAQISIWDHRGQKVFFFTKNAVTSSIRLTSPVPLAKGACLVSFFLSFFLSNNDCFFFHMLDWMFTKLGQKHVWMYGYKSYGSKKFTRGHMGSQGSKNVNHVKNMKNSSNSKSYYAIL